jgi:hypothetical protein
MPNQKISEMTQYLGALAGNELVEITILGSPNQTFSITLQDIVDLFVPATGGAGAAQDQAIPVAVGDETTALTTGTAKVTFRMPFAFTLSEVRASVTTAPTGASLLTVDINENGASILSTKITIDASEKTSFTAATPPVISDVNLANDAEITIDIDQVGSTIAGAGLKVYLIGTPL